MEIIDCHVNVGWDANNTKKGLIPNRQSYLNLLAKMEINNISKAVMVPFPSPSGQFNKSNNWYDLENHYLMNAKNHSKKLIPFPAVNPKDNVSVENINTLAVAFGVKGIKFSHQIPMEFSIDSLIKHRIMDIVHEHNLIFMIHVGTGKEAGAQYVHTTLNYAVEVARNYPDVKFIFCHLGRLHSSLKDALDLENVFLDTAALSMWKNWQQFLAKEPLLEFKKSHPSQVIQTLVDWGHENKILFGSDEPYASYKSEIDNINNAQIPDSVKRKIFYENISNLLK
jgi:predicted TIM-barrel fold metal-dependent hydrolase